MAAGALVLCVMLSSLQSPSSLLVTRLASASTAALTRGFLSNGDVGRMRQDATSEEEAAKQLGETIHQEMSLLAARPDASSSSIIAAAELAATKAAIVAAAQRTQSEASEQTRDERGFLAGVNQDMKMRQLAQYLHLDKRRVAHENLQSKAGNARHNDEHGSFAKKGAVASRQASESGHVRRNVNPEVRNALESVFHGILHKIDLFESTPSLSETSSNEGISSATSRPKSQAKQAQQRSLQVQGPNKEQVIASELAKRIQRLRERETAHRNAALLDMNEASAIKKAAALKIAKVFHEDHHSEEEVYL